jgi:hypothetical protein
MARYLPPSLNALHCAGLPSPPRVTALASLRTLAYRSYLHPCAVPACIALSCSPNCMLLPLHCTCAAPVYLGCFKYDPSGDGNPPGLPSLLKDEMESSNTTKQCWQLALREERQQLPLFGIRGRQCYGGNELGLATSTTPAADAACLAGDPNVRGPRQQNLYRA